MIKRREGETIFVPLSLSPFFLLSFTIDFPPRHQLSMIRSAFSIIVIAKKTGFLYGEMPNKGQSEKPVSLSL